jgi:hypothetical protein
MRRWRAVAALVAAGAPGILTLVPLSLPAVFQQLQRTGQVAPPIPVLVIALALQPFILLVLSAAVGMLFASRPPSRDARRGVDSKTTSRRPSRWDSFRRWSSRC